MEPRNLIGHRRHDKLAAFLVRNVVRGAKSLHGGASSHAVARFYRTCAVVNAGVNDATVVSRLMGSYAIFFFNDEQTFGWKAACKLEGSCESDDAGADN